MKKTVLFCLTLLVLPAFMADAGNAALTQSEKRYCQRKAEKYADEKSLGTTAGGAIAGALAGGIIGGVVTGGKGSGVCNRRDWPHPNRASLPPAQPPSPHEIPRRRRVSG